MAEHTNGRWLSKDGTTVLGSEGIHVCSVTGVSRNDAVNVANANRIVACVNACAGIDQVLLEASEPGLVQRMIAEEVQRIRQQRDDLLAALQGLVEHEGTVDDTGIGEMPSEALMDALKQADIVISSVKDNLL